MISREKIRNYVGEVRGRIGNKTKQIENADFDNLTAKEQIQNIVDKEQCRFYLEFINEFERIVLAMNEDVDDDYGPAL